MEEVHDVVFDPVRLEADSDASMTAPLELSVNARDAVIMSTLKRVCAAGADGANSAIWAPLLSRLISRGLVHPESTSEHDRESAEQLRQVLFNFIAGNLQTR